MWTQTLHGLRVRTLLPNGVEDIAEENREDGHGRAIHTRSNYSEKYEYAVGLVGEAKDLGKTCLRLLMFGRCCRCVHRDDGDLIHFRLAFGGCHAPGFRGIRPTVEGHVSTKKSPP